MFHVVLHHPQIPPNTGNAIRLCANTGSALHLIRPLGFELSDAHLRRAGLDYHELAVLNVHDRLADFREAVAPQRMLAFTTAGERFYHDHAFRPGDALLFGCEADGLPAEVLDDIPEGHRLRIPMRAGNRSINLSNTVAVAVYEAWRQQGFDGAV